MGAEAIERLIAEALTAVEAKREAIDPFDISSLIERAFPKPEPGTMLTPASIAELTAFLVTPNYSDKESGWDSYFGPFMTWGTREGGRISNPQFSTITPAVLAHWRRRAEESRHPVLKARYADLCWEFGKRVTKEKEPISTVRHAIDAYIEIANEELYEHDSFAIDNLRRALSLAISVKDAERIKAAKLAMIQLESRIAKDELMGLWGFALEELSKVGALDQQERETLLAGLEGRLIRVSDETVPNYLATPQLAEHAATLLANEYRKDGRTEDVQRVIRVVGLFYRRASRETSAMVAGAWLMHMRELYHNYGLSAEAAELDAEIAEYGKKSRDEMTVISANVEISTEEIEKYVSKLTEG